MKARMRARLLAAPLAAVLLMGGALVVSAVPAGAVDVSTEAELRAAFDSENEITLLNDITLVDCDDGDVDRSTAVGPLTLDGQGFSIIQTCRDRVLDVDNGADVTLMNVTITGGFESNDGGGIDINDGALTVIDSQFLDNCADAGGAIEGETMTIVRSTFAGNRGAEGGVLTNSLDDALTIVNSTLTDNSAIRRGAIDSDGASLQMTYTTLVENTFTTEEPPCVVDGASVTEDDAPEDDAADAGDVGPAQVDAANLSAGNGLDPQDVSIFGSVISTPIGAVNCDFEDGTTVSSQGYNFSDDDTCELTGTGDTENGSDPQLGALADNGGPTQTRLPAATSPLLDHVALAACAGPEGDITTDQRGVTRPQGPGCDTGAVEVEVEVVEPIVLVPTFTG